MSGSFRDLHTFSDETLLRQALTHSSTGEQKHNERLEWLGDALLDFVIGAALFARHPKADEGALTHARASLVNGKTLAACARKIGLPKALRVSGGEARGGGRQRDSMLADVFEAYIAAVYLDGGITAAQKVADAVFNELIPELDAAIKSGGGALKDGKTQLQEYLQKRGRPTPQYQVIKRGETAKRPFIVVECRLDENQTTVAVAGNRREAEQLAGCCMLATLLT